MPILDYHIALRATGAAPDLKPTAFFFFFSVFFLFFSVPTLRKDGRPSREAIKRTSPLHLSLHPGG